MVIDWYSCEDIKFDKLRKKVSSKTFSPEKLVQKLKRTHRDHRIVKLIAVKFLREVEVEGNSVVSIYPFEDNKISMRPEMFLTFSKFPSLKSYWNGTKGLLKSQCSKWGSYHAQTRIQLLNTRFELAGWSFSRNTK